MQSNDDENKIQFFLKTWVEHKKTKRKQNEEKWQ